MSQDWEVEAEENIVLLFEDIRLKMEDKVGLTTDPSESLLKFIVEECNPDILRGVIVLAAIHGDNFFAQLETFINNER